MFIRFRIMIKIKLDIYKDMIKHCKETFPLEACGVLAGKGSEVKKIYRMQNSDKSSSSFFMEPKEQLDVMKEIRNSGLEMLAIYHAHPYTKAYPSGRDVELAFYPECKYVIISLQNSKAPKVRSFKIEKDKIREEIIKIEGGGKNAK